MRRRYVSGNNANSKYGVFILHNDGELYESSKWNISSSYAVGVAVITPAHSFVIAKSVVKSGNWGGGFNNYLMSGVSTFEGNYEKARTDYKGKSNTEAILSYNVTNCAAYYCNAYTFPNGKQGYLPAAGELYIVMNNRDEINKCLNKLGTPIGNENYWSSTQWHAVSAWACNYIDGCWGTPKSNTYYVRPFTSLE